MLEKKNNLLYFLYFLVFILVYQNHIRTLKKINLMIFHAKKNLKSTLKIKKTNNYLVSI
jgi:hypothetical protein